MSYIANRWVASLYLNDTWLLYLYSNTGKLVAKVPGKSAASLGEGKIAVKTDSNHFIIINNDGKRLSENVFNSIYSFKKGIAMARVESAKKYEYLYGFIDSQGEWVIPPIYSEATDFNDETAIVILRKKQFSINRQGKTSEISQGHAEPLANDYRFYSISSPVNKKWIKFSSVITDNNNKVIIENVRPKAVLNGLYFLAGENDKKFYGLLDVNSGKVQSFDVKPGEVLGYVYDADDRMPAPEKFFWISAYSSTGENIYRLYDRQQTLLLERAYARVRPFYGDYAWVKPTEKEEWVLIDARGNIVSEVWNTIEPAFVDDVVITSAYKSDDSTIYYLGPQGDIIYYQKEYSA